MTSSPTGYRRCRTPPTTSSPSPRSSIQELAPLTVTPKPDSVVRVHMVYLPLEQPIEIPEQELTPMERTGFTVVEWGGTDASYMKQ